MKTTQIVSIRSFAIALRTAFALVSILTPSLAHAQFISQIQGDRHVSLYNGKCVPKVYGIVTRVVANGFYMQDEKPDYNPLTSDGIFVFTSVAPTVSVLDRVRVAGKIEEFAGTGPNRGTLTEITFPTSPPCTPQGVTVIGQARRLPKPIFIGAGGLIPPTEVIYNTEEQIDLFALNPVLIPDQNGYDFWEALEGMRVELRDVIVVGPTRSFSGGSGREVVVIPDEKGGWATSRTHSSGMLLLPDDQNPERVKIQDVAANIPIANVGDRLRFASAEPGDYRITGPLTFNASIQFFAVTPDEEIVADSAGLEQEVTSLDPALDYLTIATFNVQNLSPSDALSKFEGLARQICYNFQTPDVLALSEVLNNSMGSVSASVTWNRLRDTIESECGLRYWYVQINPETAFSDGGPNGRGVRQGFLLNRNGRVFYQTGNEGGSLDANDVLVEGGHVRLRYYAGRIDPTNPVFNTSAGCFSRTRKPLALQVEFNFHRIFLIGNHFNAKIEDSPLYGRLQPPDTCTEEQRVQIAAIITDFTQQILTLDPDANVVVLGDLNDYQWSNTLATLEATVPPTSNAIYGLSPDDAYTHDTDGNSQALDHILHSWALTKRTPEVDIVHLNAEFPSKALTLAVGAITTRWS